MSDPDPWNPKGPYILPVVSIVVPLDLVKPKKELQWRL